MKPEIEYLIESEYQATRNEIATQLAAIRTLEAGALAGVGALLAWLYTHPDVVWEAWLLPVALIVATGLRAWSLHKSVQLLGEFIQGREVALVSADSSSARWETWRAPHSAGVLITSVVFWIVLLAITILAGLYRPAASPASTGLMLRCLPEQSGLETSGVVIRCEPTGK
jgi:hypothetical protein